jgi:hypothetical protein
VKSHVASSYLHNPLSLRYHHSWWCGKGVETGQPMLMMARCFPAMGFLQLYAGTAGLARLDMYNNQLVGDRNPFAAETSRHSSLLTDAELKRPQA